MHEISIQYIAAKKKVVFTANLANEPFGKGNFMKRFVYADNAATTAPSREVIEAMMPALDGAWGNPSSLHAKGREAKKLLDGARESIAKSFNCLPSEIYFTSCGTESDNWAIKGAAQRYSGA